MRAQYDTMTEAELDIRMADHLVVDETVAMPALVEGKLVCALRPQGWGLVESIEPHTRRGESAVGAFVVTFAGDGYVRVFCKGGTFWVEVTA